VYFAYTTLTSILKLLEMLSLAWTEQDMKHKNSRSTKILEEWVNRIYEDDDRRYFFANKSKLLYIFMSKKIKIE
jgi:hypothetical protein